MAAIAQQARTIFRIDSARTIYQLLI